MSTVDYIFVCLLFGIDGLGVPMKLYELNSPGSKPRAGTYTKKKIFKYSVVKFRFDTKNLS